VREAARHGAERLALGRVAAQGEHVVDARGGELVRMPAISSRVWPVQLRWAIGFKPIWCLMFETSSTTWPRFEPIAP